MRNASKSNILVLRGEVDDDVANRIHKRVTQSLRHFKLVYNTTSVMLSWTDKLSHFDHSSLVEDVTSLFNSINFTAPICCNEPVIGKVLADEWVDIIMEHYNY